MRKLINAVFIAIGVLMINPVVAQKFGYIDTQSIIQDLPEVKEANSNIETFKKQLQNKGQEMLKAWQTKYQNLERRQAQGEIAPKELEVEAQKLKDEENGIILFEQQSQAKIGKKSEELLSPIRDKIQQAIDSVADENGYTYIFDFSTGFVLYADQSADVSSLVKKKLGL
ncbi:MAG: OmpH family outer membrane protein [Saprospiraceae bacterium]|nr:OmpH family outer membrane protein [Bacteroidia bacterium]NNE15162.1 OmpH family outer membrane protein [Saprospiraceae bacterium]NNL91948.1 OmpH family outer membrane protein [Saprospiraceae bacterium]